MGIEIDILLAFSVASAGISCLGIWGAIKKREARKEALRYLLEEERAENVQSPEEDMAELSEPEMVALMENAVLVEELQPLSDDYDEDEEIPKLSSKQSISIPSLGIRYHQIMQGGISTIVLLSALYIVLTGGPDSDTQKWAFGIIGTIVGYWLRVPESQAT